MLLSVCSSVRNAVGSLLDAFDDVIFPRHCLITGDYIGQSPTRLPGVSDAITDALPPGPAPLDILALLQRNFSEDELLLTTAFARYAVQTDSDADKIIYAIKYGQRTKLAAALGHEVGATLRSLLEDNALPQAASGFSKLCYDVVIPVPIHAARLRERGYNQAALIARSVANALDLTYAEPLTRTRYTGTQTTLDASHRLANVANAFELSSRSRNGKASMQEGFLKGARVLIVDDVLTTGATMNACAEVLLNAGARRVDGAAVAVAL
jgi:ComF family protein